MLVRSKYTYYFPFFLMFFLYQCTSSSNSNEGTAKEIQVEFNSIEPQSTSILKNITFVKLETGNDILLDNVIQTEVFEEIIYILCGSGLYAFDLSGNYIRSIITAGDGPGEFLSPYSFWIDKEGFVYILDRQLNRLQKYQTENFNFVETITMPHDSPIGFAKIEKNDVFIYYYPLRLNRGIEEKQLFIANKKGEIISDLYIGNASGKILHGNNSNFYKLADKLMFYPYFSNKIYEIDTDTLFNSYALSFKGHEFPDQNIFTKYDNSGDIMKEILFGKNEWIRLIYIYETETNLVVKYYIKKDFYIAAWNKINNTTINFKYSEVKDDLGIGGKFPLPIGVYDDQFIGIINPYDIDKDLIKNIELKKMTDNISEEDNPILCFYTI